MRVQTEEDGGGDDPVLLFARLPNSGAALRVLDLGDVSYAWRDDDRARAGFERLGAAIGGLPGLRMLRACMTSDSASRTAKLLNLLSAGASAAPAQLEVGCLTLLPAGSYDVSLAALLPLGRLRGLKLLAGNGGLPFASQLFEPTALTNYAT